MWTGLILSMSDLIISVGKRALYTEVGKFYNASRGWFLMEGEISCCTGDNCNINVTWPRSVGTDKNIAISYETNTLDCT